MYCESDSMRKLRVDGRRLVAAVLAASAAWAGQTMAQSSQWPSKGNGILNQSYASAETTINVNNASKLNVLWTYTAAGPVWSTPTIDGTYLYVTDLGGYLTKLNRSDGSVVWKQLITKYSSDPNAKSRSSPAIAGSAVIIGDFRSALLHGVDKNTGAPLWTTDLSQYGPGMGMITGSPVVYNNVAYVGVSSWGEALAKSRTFRGSIAAVDVNTGKLLWQTPTVPAGYSGGAVWSSNAVIDVSRNALYVTTGENYTVPIDVATCMNASVSEAQKIGCQAADNAADAIMSLNLSTGAVNWIFRAIPDVWNLQCGLPTTSTTKGGTKKCPVVGDHYDYDFGAGPNMINSSWVGAGQKSGVYYVLNANDGSLVWETAAGPGGLGGGVEWGTATDGKYIYLEEANISRVSFKLAGTNTNYKGGSWAALNAATGAIVWQTPTPGKSSNMGAVTIANGVLFGGTDNKNFVAMNASTGEILWTYGAGAAVVTQPAVADGVVYWGAGSWFSKGSKTLYAFTVPSN